MVEKNGFTNALKFLHNFYQNRTNTSVYSTFICWKCCRLTLKRRDWNSLSEEHRNSTSVASFKHTLNKRNISVPKYFYVGDRRPQILHTRLRTKCSALNYEIYLKNLTDTPLCRCGNIENKFRTLLSTM